MANPSEDRAWLAFRGSDLQRVMHDHWSSELESIRTQLETATEKEIPTLQGSAAVVRRVLAFIHAHDTPQITETYG